jgi:hypothetical protein
MLGQYLIFTEMQLQPDRRKRLAELAYESAVILLRSHPHELLGNGAAAFDNRTCGCIAACRASDAYEVKSEMVVETSIFDAEDSLYQVLGNILALDIGKSERTDPSKSLAIRSF